MWDHRTVGDQFKGFFTHPYDGRDNDGTTEYYRGREDFIQLTDYAIHWAQVHGDFKDAVKRALFVPYPHWPELHQACADVIRQHTKLGTQYTGRETCVRLMRDAMKLLRARHGFNTPKWWLPLMDQMRGVEKKEPQRRPRQVELRDSKVVYYR